MIDRLIQTRAAAADTPVGPGGRAGSHRRAWQVVIVAATAVLLCAIPGWAAEDPNLEQEIDRDQEVATEPAVLDDGHVDMGPRYVDDEWIFLVHDDTVEPPVWRVMDQTVFHVTDAALLAVPDNDTYSFLPAPPGAEVHVVPQAQQPGVVWLGWNTQDPTVMETIDRGATLRLRGVSGPGEMVVFLQSGDLGDPDPLWDSREEYPQDIWVEVNTHTHANWVFSEPGIYLVEMEVTADLVTGGRESRVEVLRFAVGTATSTADALDAEHIPADLPEGDADEPANGADPDGTAAEESDDGPGVATGLLIAGAAAAVLVAAAVVVVVRGRRVKARAAAGPAVGSERTGGGTWSTP
ncbi:choice-of-anchor M domain-containing protein [Phytoactinopolyspora limicola]|uniref:choice-of-anchor M domain-containing protein n=1 Tax=Phytoactinopolyspora limicola TaxID=2715536 RepID=UPI001409ABE8|nr:choice-of-anchor M domain-containing protein [Phytoactinopolyspora limicola]